MYVLTSQGLGQVTTSGTKLSHINIYMRDLAAGEDYNEGAVRTCLENMFCEACKMPASRVITARVFWLTRMLCPLPQPHDVIVYILKNHGQSQSIIKRVYGVPPDSRFAGATMSGPKGWISEVYLDSAVNQDDKGLTYMIFHELLHNKCQKGDSLHTECGAGTTDIASRSHTAGGVLETKFGECDKRLMAPHLGDQVKQYCA
jgi:hypothetical protein